MSKADDKKKNTGSGNMIFEGTPSCIGSCTDWCSNTSWRISAEYIERTSGVCCPKIDNIQMIRVSDIRYTTNCCCDSCGTIIIFSKDPNDPELQIKGLPHGREVYDKIRDAFNSLTTGQRVNVITS